MRQLRLPIFTSKIKYYNLRIVPPGHVFNEVREFKKQFEYLYGRQPLSGSKPHITIATFKMNSNYQELLVEIFSKLSRKEAFKLALKGFGQFEGSRTLYMNVSKNIALENIHQEVRFLHREYLIKKLKSFYISENPYMTISKTKGKKMLAESLEHFKKYGYSKQIGVDQLILVSRSKYKTWDWEHQIGLS